MQKHNLYPSTYHSVAKLAMAALMQKWNMTFVLFIQSSQKLYSVSYIIISGDVLCILNTCLQYVTHLKLQ